jgi:hypothetical protein
MRALTKLVFGGDEYGPSYARKQPTPATLELGMTKADFSSKNLGAVGAIIISAWITHKDNGALVKLDISSNRIEAEQERDLQRICAAGGIELAK